MFIPTQAQIDLYCKTMKEVDDMMGNRPRDYSNENVIKEIGSIFQNDPADWELESKAKRDTLLNLEENEKIQALRSFPQWVKDWLIRAETHIIHYQRQKQECFENISCVDALMETMTFEQAKESAIGIAQEFDENIYVAECAIYARSYDEYGEGPYIVGSLGVFATMFNRLKEFGGKVVAVADAQGEVFVGDVDLI